MNAPTNDIRVSFDNPEDFQAARAAEAWCAERGISVGRSQGHAPRGLLYGDFDIAKWRNLTSEEIAALDGRMFGDMRRGPVHIVVRPPEDPAVAEADVALSRNKIERHDAQAVRDELRLPYFLTSYIGA